MVDWETDLPEDVESGDSGHPEMHNQATDAIREIRDLVDGGELDGEDGYPSEDDWNDLVDSVEGLQDDVADLEDEVYDSE